MPRFSFFTAHSKEPVNADSPIWHAPIPLRLDALMKHDGESVSHAVYFRAAQTFIEANSFEVMTLALSRQLGCDVQAPEIEEIRICLEKHGAFYHPARIETTVGQQQLSFVLNVAISETGRRFIEKEFHLLNRLNAEQPSHDLPQVYGFGRTAGSNDQNYAMFLGEWFNGYHEFHVSIDPVDQKPKIMVWDDAHGRFFLSTEQTKTLYAQASKILTGYYNLESCEQILSWHHAAGDFVVRAENGELELKLISVRQYAALFKSAKDLTSARNDSELMLQALLIFFLNLSIHTRLDRLDGIGEMAWSDSIAVEASLIGILEALSMKPDVPSFPDSPLACFIAYLSSCTERDLIDLTEAIINRFNPQMPGLAVVKNNMHTHVETLHTAIQQILSI